MCYSETSTTKIELDSPEGKAAWNDMLRFIVEVGLAYFVDVDGQRVDEPVTGADGILQCRLIKIEDKPLPQPLTIGDRSGPPRDAMDGILAKLPWSSTKRAKAEALLRANCTGPEIIAKLRVSPGTVAEARAAILRRYDELVGRGETPDPLPEAVTNPTGRALRGVPRPDMVHGSGTSMMERRAADLGVTVEEAIQLRADARRARRFRERPEDSTALNMRRVRRRV